MLIYIATLGKCRGIPLITYELPLTYYKEEKLSKWLPAQGRPAIFGGRLRGNKIEKMSTKQQTVNEAK